MRIRLKIGMWLGLGCSLAPVCTGQKIAAVSESTLTVSGAGIEEQTYRLAQMYGDWFVTPSDGHATLTLRTLPGPRQAQLTVGWDGKGLTQTIDSTKHEDSHRNDLFAFDLHLTGPAPYNQSAAPQGSDAVTVTITKMDDLALEASFNGTITGRGPLKVSGAIRLHRSAPTEKPTGTFGSCDPVIHDRLAGAEARSPSECEIQFDSYLRKALADVLAPVTNGFTASGWRVVKQSSPGPIDAIARNTEGKPYQLESSQPGLVSVSLALSPDSEVYRRYNQASQDAMAAAIKQMQAGVININMDTAHKAAKALEEHTTLSIGIAINEGAAISIFKGGHTVTPFPGGGFMVSAPFVQPATGGDESAAQNVTSVFLGPVSQPASAGPSTGSETVQVKANLNSAANQLSVQTIRVRIQSGDEATRRAINLIDWDALRRLMGQK